MNELEKYRMSVQEIISDQRAFFATGETKNIQFRLRSLRRLYDAVSASESEILDALHGDLHKSSEEGYLTEVSIVLSEIKYHIKNLKRWAKPHPCKTPLHLWPSRSYTMMEPLGITLILAPWNYPFQLLLNPLIGALSAGNCVILKPSPQSPKTNEIVKKIVEKVFVPEYVCVVSGDSDQTKIVLEEQFDFIFYTGSPLFAKEVMAAAAKYLTPVVLELGGKSPCIVDQESNLNLAAKRIVWGKFINAGQTCVAPDYILVHDSLESQLIELLKQYITRFYGNNTTESPRYPHIINTTAFERLKSYLSDGNIACGGYTNQENRYFSPTILRNVTPDSDVMRSEIFGPILPILTYENIAEAVDFVNARPKPLALYYFGAPKTGKEVLRKTSSGGACINDVLLHIANHNLPFGGVGNSGMGKYHGKYSFQTFSNEKAVVCSSTFVDFNFKYIPFKYFSAIKNVLKL